jgi:hypothetical protein
MSRPEGTIMKTNMSATPTLATAKMGVMQDARKHRLWWVGGWVGEWVITDRKSGVRR